MMKMFAEKNGGALPCAISTFGFGYNLESDLLDAIAVEGGSCTVVLGLCRPFVLAPHVLFPHVLFAVVLSRRHGSGRPLYTSLIIRGKFC